MSTIWRDILSIGRENEKAKTCFIDGFPRQISDGAKTNFWSDVWLGSSSFKLEFPRLYNLSLDKEMSVADLKPSKGQGWHFNWRHEPFGRELDEYKRLEDTLKPINIHDTKPDNFNWIHCPSGYSAKSAYQILENPTTCLQGSICSLIWNPLVPSKVSFMIWRLFLNRLPTKDNLCLPGVNLTNNPNCVFCGDHPEDANHIFAKCRQSQKLWSKICHWWGFLFVPPDNAFAMLHQLSSLQVPKKARRSWNLTISTAAWSIWVSRNGIIFEKQPWNENRLIDLIQSRTFCWIKGNSTCAKFNFVDWCQFPLHCAIDF
ncbi:hypothetical protein SLEP1_g21750 [Rubroshorea leprosula]|uniref:Reverse transcriptase zinc-binding domain-containing protein n=1 Tax=Rubroshorea leprosula TaxID=152421 RepID=A0AAV5JJ39_9ROSI|nr:hypothetical protein SLEP1_g21750 [Rubroshorea leprosula]